MSGKLVVLDNPLVQTYVTGIRDKKTPFHQFRSYVDKLASMLAYESARELSVKSKQISTPLVKISGKTISQDIVLVPILRAGLGLVNGFTNIFPKARVGHIGLFRNEATLKPVKYYFRFPKIKLFANTIVYILDPMLATGGSITWTISELRKIGVKKIVITSLVSAPEGVKEVRKRYKNIPIYTCALDKKLNDKGYIVPGLGDAGDRMFGT